MRRDKTMAMDCHVHILEEGAPDQAGLLKRMRKAGVEGGIIVSLPPETFELIARPVSNKRRLENLLAWRGEDSRLHPFHWIDPLEKDAASQVGEAARRGVAGFKIICDRFYPGDKRALRICRQIAALGKPVLFHSGILWDGRASSKFNRPAEFEALLDVEGLRFAMAHISWPWCDELVALCGKFNYVRNCRKGRAAELFVDTAPGTPPIYRADALNKLINGGCDVSRNVIFGSDCKANSYDSDYVARRIAGDKKIFKEIGVSKEQEKNIFGGNLRRFLGI